MIWSSYVGPGTAGAQSKVRPFHNAHGVPLLSPRAAGCSPIRKAGRLIACTEVLTEQTSVPSLVIGIDMVLPHPGGLQNQKQVTGFQSGKFA